MCFPTTEELVLEQNSDNYCKNFSLPVGQMNIEYHLDGRDLLIYRSVAVDPMQIVVLESLHNRMQCPSQFPSIARSSCHRTTKDGRQCTNLWPHIASDAYATIAKCKSWVKNENQQHLRRRIKRFLATGPHELLAMDILGSLRKKNKETIICWKWLIGNSKSHAPSLRP